ncbi:MAG: hypothetical protein IPG17_20050 [Sandaracinaceae bacterium]|nr:hypothetical protein [Sandaracinaceae bacterium]
MISPRASAGAHAPRGRWCSTRPLRSRGWNPGTCCPRGCRARRACTDGPRGARLLFHPERLSPALAERFAGQLEVLLSAALRDPQQSVRQAAAHHRARAQRLLTEWNPRDTDHPRELGVHQLFELQVQRTPDAIALVHRGTRLTYAEP